jgi:hypothetical protein
VPKRGVSENSFNFIDSPFRFDPPLGRAVCQKAHLPRSPVSEERYRTRRSANTRCSRDRTARSVAQKIWKIYYYFFFLKERYPKVPICTFAKRGELLLNGRFGRRKVIWYQQAHRAFPTKDLNLVLRRGLRDSEIPSEFSGQMASI